MTRHSDVVRVLELYPWYEPNKSAPRWVRLVAAAVWFIALRWQMYLDRKYGEDLGMLAYWDRNA